tara:strand:+ start:34 stop:681 length:648 start_codon:yes stop_codon:yes gene_type:complete
MPDIIGIFGGTFDPVHNGHTKTISYLLKLIPFKKIIVIPNAKPPQGKEVIGSVEDRLAMTILAFKKHRRVVVDDRESLRPGPSYAIDTVKEILKEEKISILSMIVGSDVFAEIDSWHHWEELFRLVHFVVMKRPDYPIPKKKKSFQLINKGNSIEELAKADGTGKVIEVRVKPMKVSSTRIRKNLATGRSIESLVGSEVRDYLLINKLYGRENKT